MTLKLTIAQFNPTLGDFSGNAAKIQEIWRANPQSDLIVTPEFSLAGYQPEDLILNHSFAEMAQKTVWDLAKHITKGAVLIGSPWIEGGQVYNAAVLLANGQVDQVTMKHELPNYGVFDEPRVFTPGPLPKPISIKGVAIGVLICEDMWHSAAAKHLAENGAKLLISINGSPYEIQKDFIRKSHAHDRCMETELPLLYVNLWGAQDDVVYDGGSFLYGANGRATAQAPMWREFIGDVEFDPATAQIKPLFEKYDAVLDEEPHIYEALCLGLKNYSYKNGFSNVLLGLSGGIDSALVAAIAVDALGADKVRAVMMPSPYTSQDSLDDAKAVADLLNIRLDTIPITPMMQSVERQIGAVEELSGLSLENLQSRLRGLTLMALSNQTGALLLSTGNKSEMAVGYSTLYGDMCGGFAPIKDVYKTQIFNLCRWRNQKSVVMPERVIAKAPTAELRPNQTDQDSLPPYALLDRILYKLIEQDQSVAEIVRHGFDQSLVLKIAGLLDKAEYKRRQAPPGVKISARAFGRDRRWPITNRWKRV